MRLLPAYYGRVGTLKGQLAEQFRYRARESGFVTDVSTDKSDAFPGDEWYRFLGSCRFTIAARGGASICDSRGAIRRKVDEYLRRWPNATFDEIESACFPGLDRHDFSAVTPRLFEAAALRTGLILIEDDYVAGLEPYRHYIPLERDLSNLEQVFSIMRDGGRIEAMIEAAYQHLIVSGQFSYRVFVDGVLAEVERKCPRPASREQFAGLKRHYQRLAPSQRLRVEAPPIWLQVARSTALRADKQGQLDAVAKLVAARRKGVPFRCVVSAELGGADLLSPDLSGPAIESIEALADGQHALADLASFLDSTIEGYWRLDNDFGWGHCEYVYDPFAVLRQTGITSGDDRGCAAD